MFKTMMFEVPINEQRKLEIQLPTDLPLGMASVMVVVAPHFVVQPSFEAGWQALLAIGEYATDDAPVDLATRHDDYLYGEANDQ